MSLSLRGLVASVLVVVLLASFSATGAFATGVRANPAPAVHGSATLAAPTQTRMPRTDLPSLRAAIRETHLSVDAAAPSRAVNASPDGEILAGWDGLHVGTDAGISNPWVPPDVQVAAGPSHIVEMVNLLMGVYTKSGSQLQVTPLATLFNSGTDFISDPKVQYDPSSGRWFATVTDVTAEQVLVAVSQTTDPTGLWHLSHAPSSRATGECLDQPILGVGSSTVIVSVNVFTQTKSNPCTAPFLGAQYWVLNKTDLVNGAGSPATFASLIDPTEGSIHPVQIEGASAVHYMVSTFWPGTATTSNTLHLFTVSGTPPATVTVTVASLSMPTAALPPPAPQLGTKHTLDTADLRISDAAWQAGKLWLGFDEACLSDATRACVRMVEIDTGTILVLQDFDIDVAGTDVFYPAFRMDGAGSLAVVFAYSSALGYPGLMASGRLVGDAPNTLQPPTVVMPGAGPENPTTCTGTCRYGDYFGAGLDPSNGSQVWLAGEFGTPSGWGTHVFSAAVKAALTFAYRVVGGGIPAPLPTISFVSNGVGVVAPLSTTPTTYYADPASTWSVTPNVQNPAVPGEFWSINSLTINPPYFGEANASTSSNFTYYHQYAVHLAYSVLGLGTHIAPSVPLVNVTEFGQPRNVSAGMTWVIDAGTPFTYPGTLQGSTSTYRLSSRDPLTGTVSGVLNVTVRYYAQYLVSFGYVVQSSGSLPAPDVHYFSNGANTSVVANGTVWADAGQPYTYPGFLGPSGAYTRIGADAGYAGTITGSGSILVLYRLQYLLTVAVEPALLHDNVSGSGWHDAGSSATVVATTPPGWKFIGYSGAASGSAAAVAVLMSGPLNVTAVFYPGLTLAASDGGSIAYSYGNVSGTVAAGSDLTLYVPTGTTVTLVAQPSSWTSSFDGWGGALSTSSSTTSVSVNGPARVTASFTSHAMVLYGVAAGLIVVILAALVLVFAARRRKKRPPA